MNCPLCINFGRFQLLQVSAGSNFLGSFAFDESLFDGTAEKATETTATATGPTVVGGVTSAAPAFEDDDDGLFFGTPSGTSSNSGKNKGGFASDLGAGEESTSILPPPESVVQKQEPAESMFGRLFQSEFGRPASFGQHMFTGSNSEQEEEGDSGHPAEQQEENNNDSVFGREKQKAALYDAVSISEWMAGRLPRPTLGKMSHCSLT